MPVDETWIVRIADLTAETRRELHGARKWDPPGIATAIRKVAHLQLADVVAACMRAASDRTIDTPAPIGDTRSSAWRERLAEIQPTKPRICRIHGTQHAGGICPSCRADRLGTDTPRPPIRHGALDAEAAAAITAELRDRIRPPAQTTATDPATAPGLSIPEEER